MPNYSRLSGAFSQAIHRTGGVPQSGMGVGLHQIKRGESSAQLKTLRREEARRFMLSPIYQQQPKPQSDYAGAHHTLHFTNKLCNT